MQHATHRPTPYEEMTGHRVKHKVAGFGERAHFKMGTDTVQYKCDGEWSEGYFMGVITMPSEHLVMRGDNVYTCLAMRRRPHTDA